MNAPDLNPIRHPRAPYIKRYGRNSYLVVFWDRSRGQYHETQVTQCREARAILAAAVRSYKELDIANVPFKPSAP